MKKKPDLQIDSVATIRRIRDAQHDRLKDSSWEEKVAFFRERAAEFHATRRESEDYGTRETEQ